MTNLEWFRTFKTVYEQGSITKAAEVLFISQPGASLHLSSLESFVGYKLFERQPRKLIPTEKGKLLYNAVVGPLLQLQEIEKNFQKTTRKDTPTITVGMCFETFQVSLEKYLPELTFNLIAEFGDYPELLSKLEQGIVDIVVTPRKQGRKGIIYHPFSQEHIVLVAGKSTDTSCFRPALESGNHNCLIDWLKNQIWYGITGDNEHLHNFWKLNFNSHPDFRPNYIVPNILSIVRSLNVSPGLAVLPDFLCRSQIEQGTINILWNGFKPLTNTLYFASRKNAAHFPLLEQIEQFLKKEMPDLL